MSTLNAQDQTLLFICLVFALMASFVTLFWSIEDQRAKRRISGKR